MAKDRDKASDELKTMLGFSGLVRPAANRAGIDRQQLGDVSLPDSRQAALNLLQEAAAIGIGSPDELVEGVSDHVADSLDPDQSRLESVEIAWLGVHRRVHVDKSRIQRRPLLVAEIGGLELRLQVGEPSAYVRKTLVCGAIYLRMAGYLVEGFLECGLDALDLGVDLDQPTTLGVFGGGCGQAVFLLSA